MGNHLEFTLNQVVNYLADKFSRDFGISKSEARRYLIDALTYNVVVEELGLQIEFLIEQNEQHKE